MGARGLVIPRKSHLRFRWDDIGAAELRRFAQGGADAARAGGRARQSLRAAGLRCNAEGLAGSGRARRCG